MNSHVNSPFNFMHRIYFLSNNINGDNVKIKDAMSKKLIIGKNTDTIKEISELMKKNDIGFIPISKNNKIIGVITDRDIVTRAIESGAKGDSKIESYISPNIISCDINENTSTVLDIMKKSKIKRLIITDSEKVVGVISISDLLNEDKVFDTFKEIYTINRNDDYFKTEIDEFYL